MEIAAFIILLIIIVYTIVYSKGKTSKKPGTSSAFRAILEEKVQFYLALNNEDRALFENRMLVFLNAVSITGVQTKVEDEDRVLIAASAIIPIFGFKNWEYNNLDEVLLYPGNFNEDFEIEERKERPVMGMVGNGPMHRVMILSQHALREGFNNSTDKNNTAIHEFVHLVDKTDGDIDGIPESLLSKQFAIPWVNLMHHKIKEIQQGGTDINPYGATNQGEFFAVAAEYFFERPDLLQSKHPALYQLLEKIFCQDPNQKRDKILEAK